MSLDLKNDDTNTDSKESNRNPLLKEIEGIATRKYKRWWLRKKKARGEKLTPYEEGVLAVLEQENL